MFFNPNIYEAINLAIILTSSFYYFGVISVDFKVNFQEIYLIV